jgi:hypothetical protein
MERKKQCGDSKFSMVAVAFFLMERRSSKQSSANKANMKTHEEENEENLPEESDFFPTP